MNKWITGLLASALCFASVGCETVPATGEKKFILVSPQQEMKLSAEAGPQFLKDYGGPIPSPVVDEYVTNLGKRLAAVSELPNLPWEFHAVDSAVLNAFALPGGKVFITRQLLSKLENEAEVAGVLGHEIGHVTARHIAQQMSQQLAIQGLAVGLGVAGEAADKDYLRVLGVGAQAGGALYLLKFSRDDELQADKLGIRYMTRLGYDPRMQIRVMEILAKESGPNNTPTILLTHPPSPDRIKQIQQILAHPSPNDLTPPPPGGYKLNQAQYQSQVLVPLSKLPPPKHTGE